MSTLNIEEKLIDEIVIIYNNVKQRLRKKDKQYRLIMCFLFFLIKNDRYTEILDFHDLFLRLINLLISGKFKAKSKIINFNFYLKKVINGEITDVFNLCITCFFVVCFVEIKNESKTLEYIKKDTKYFINKIIISLNKAKELKNNEELDWNLLKYLNNNVVRLLNIVRANDFIFEK